MLSRRSFLHSSVILFSGALVGSSVNLRKKKIVMTVNGPLSAYAMGFSLIHEHILVDFIGAANYDPTRWEHEKVIHKVSPYLQELKAAGCKTFIDCTPNYLGRDARLLQRLSDLTGLQMITNTGYYGGSDNKYLPQHAFSETDLQLSNRWTKEYENGIDSTRVRPGFIKISVNSSHLSDISQKLIRAAGYCHLQTGLTIASHTGPALPAFEQLEILKQLRVPANSFIWVHAQNEKDRHQYLTAAKQGAWVSLDGLNESNVDEYVESLAFLKKEKQLHRTLISHDAGWYDPAQADGGNFRPYMTLFRKLIPALKQAQFAEKDIVQLLETNPANAFAIKSTSSKKAKV